MATQLKNKIFIDNPMTDRQDLTPNPPTDNDITTQIINASSSDTLENSVGGAAENPVDSANEADTQPAGFVAAKIHYSAALNSAAPVISDMPTDSSASIDSDPSSPDSISDVENSENYTFDESNLIAADVSLGHIMTYMVSYEQLRPVDPDVFEQAIVDDTTPVDGDLQIEETYSDEYFTEDGNAGEILPGDTEQPTDADVIGTDSEEETADVLIDDWVEEPVEDVEDYETPNDGAVVDEDNSIVDDTADPLAEWTEFVPGSYLIAQTVTYSDEYFTKDYIAGDILSGDTEQPTDADVIGTGSEEETADVLIDDWVEEPVEDVEDYETPNDGTVVDEDDSIVDDTADPLAEWTEVDPDSYPIDEPIDSNTDPLVATTYEHLFPCSFGSFWTPNITLTFDDQGMVVYETFNDGLLDEDRYIYIVDDTAPVDGDFPIEETYSDEYFTEDGNAEEILPGDTEQPTDEDIVGTDWVEEPVEDYETPNDGAVVDEDNSIVDDTADPLAEWTEVDPDSYLTDEPIDSNTDPLVATADEPLLMCSVGSFWTTNFTLTFDQGAGYTDSRGEIDLSLRDTPIERLQGGDIDLSASGSFEINTHRLLMPEHSLPELDWSTFNVSTADSVHFNQDSTPDNGGVFSGDLELTILGLPIANGQSFTVV